MINLFIMLEVMNIVLLIMFFYFQCLMSKAIEELQRCLEASVDEISRIIKKNK